MSSVKKIIPYFAPGTSLVNQFRWTGTQLKTWWSVWRCCHVSCWFTELTLSWLQQSIVKSQTVTVCFSSSLYPCICSVLLVFSFYFIPCDIFTEILWRWCCTMPLSCRICLRVWWFWWRIILQNSMFNWKTNSDSFVYYCMSILLSRIAVLHNSNVGVDIINYWLCNSSLTLTNINKIKS